MAELLRRPMDRGMDGLPPPPTQTARPEAPPSQNVHGDGQSSLGKGREILRLLAEWATTEPELATALSAIAGRITDLVAERAQSEEPEPLDDEEPPPPPPMMRPPMRSPAFGAPGSGPPGLPRR
jgi:hypothetical protein